MKRVLSIDSVRLVGLAALVLTWTLPTLALAQFGELIKKLPRSANAIVLLNMEKAKESPMGVKQRGGPGASGGRGWTGALALTGEVWGGRAWATTTRCARCPLWTWEDRCGGHGFRRW